MKKILAVATAALPLAALAHPGHDTGSESWIHLLVEHGVPAALFAAGVGLAWRYLTSRSPSAARSRAAGRRKPAPPRGPA